MLNEVKYKVIFDIVNTMSKRITFDETFRFDDEGFSGNIYIDPNDSLGFNALVVDVHGAHPHKQILNGNTRVYIVAYGTGTFTLDGQEHKAERGDMFVIEAGSEYAYSGSMQLFEFNVSPGNSFGDQLL